MQRSRRQAEESDDGGKPRVPVGVISGGQKVETKIDADNVLQGCDDGGGHNGGDGNVQTDTTAHASRPGGRYQNAKCAIK